MNRKIGKVILVVGTMITAGVVMWGWNAGIFGFSQTDAGVGLTRAFFLLIYLPIPIIVIAIGLSLAFKDTIKNAIAKSVPLKISMLVISILLFLFAMGFMGVNITWSIRYYGGDVPKVLILNLLFVSPILVLSGILFFTSRVVVRE